MFHCGFTLNRNSHQWVWGRSYDGKIQPQVLWLIPSFCVFFSSFHLACTSTCIPGRAETKRISIIPVYPCTVFFNIGGMSAFIFSALCYSKNARFAISSRGWAPGESEMSKGSPRQHPTPSKPKLQISPELRSLRRGGKKPKTPFAQPQDSSAETFTLRTNSGHFIDL